MSTLSLHYTLTQSDDNNTIQKEDDNYFDPFAIQDNNKKFGEITINKLPQTQEIDDDDDDDDVDVDHDDVDDNDGDDDDDDEGDDDDDDEDDDDDNLRKEMEESWKKEEKHKNRGMIDLLEIIRNKNKNKKVGIKKPKQKQKQKQDPLINPFVFDGNLKITFPSKTDKYIKDKQLHFHPISMCSKRKKMKENLKRKLSKKRRNEMRKHRKEFGKEEDYYYNHDKKNKYDDDDDDDNDNDDDDDINIDDDDDEITMDIKDEYSDIEEIDATKYIEDIVENGDILDEEDLARAALMAKPEIISSELRELVDIAADEEDENGKIINNEFEDEHEEKFGIAKNLLADKSEINFLKKHKEIYDIKRNEINQQLLNKENDRELELMKRAFVDGEYRKFQIKNQKNYNKLLENEENNNYDDGENELLFKSRNFELNARNEPEYYLSDNEEKNEYCCYDKNGLFYDIYTIRMKIMEWKRINNDINNNGLHLDDEEDKETIQRRQKRVARKEFISNDNNNNNNIDINNNHKISDDDKNAIKILERVRNKKQKRNQKINNNLNFNAFYESKGLQISELQRSSSSSFLDHRNKCIEKVKIAENKSKSYSSYSSSRSGKVVVFQTHNKKKRKRDNNNDNNNDNNIYKKRRIQ